MERHLNGDRFSGDKNFTLILEKNFSTIQQHDLLLHVEPENTHTVCIILLLCVAALKQSSVWERAAAEPGRGHYQVTVQTGVSTRAPEGSVQHFLVFPGTLLPPLPNRPSLTHFPNFISLPLSRLTLRPFHTPSDQDWEKVSARRHFCPQQSHVDYYR